MTDRNGPDAIALDVLDHDRAKAVRRWRFEYGMTLGQVAELGSSWHVPDDASPWFGDPRFGAALVVASELMLGGEHRLLTGIAP